MGDIFALTPVATRESWGLRNFSSTNFLLVNENDSVLTRNYSTLLVVTLKKSRRVFFDRGAIPCGARWFKFLKRIGQGA